MHFLKLSLQDLVLDLLRFGLLGLGVLAPRTRCSLAIVTLGVGAVVLDRLDVGEIAIALSLDGMALIGIN